MPGPEESAVSLVQLNYRLFAGATFCSACSTGHFSLAGNIRRIKLKKYHLLHFVPGDFLSFIHEFLLYLY